ncbi:MAG: DNA helicase [Planctomycetota bacterium]|nr:MAG: DNA helicase [Planctomycetota bacterium]
MTDPDPLLADLNEPQREAVEYGDGPLLIVAGAGSGKTRVITRRIAHLIRRGVHPGEILAITFTNKAAGEMRERVSALVGEGRVTLATFHGFCARVLRIDGEHVGLSRSYTIYDSNDQLTLIKEACSVHGIDSQSFRPRGLLSAISRLKNDGVDPDEAEVGAMSNYDRVVARVYRSYVDALTEANACDFDDLLLKVTQLFRTCPEVLQRYKTRYKHVLVDEYQDTNTIQYEIARAVADGHGNMCATGDPDQSIYRWRGARVENILAFERDFPGAKVVRLEQNYRSTQHILSAASGVIGRNAGRLLGELWSELGDGELPVVMFHEDEEAEADAVVRQVQAWREAGLRLADIAIFYRTNALSRGLERALRLHNIAYDIVGAVEFYERKEVKDLLAYLKVLANPADALAFLRVVNIPTRGIGRTSIDKLRAWALPQNIGPRDAARRASEVTSLTARPRKSLTAFSKLLDELQAFAADNPPSDVLRKILELTHYEDYLKDFGGVEASERLENVAELSGALLAYERSNSEATLTGFLEETALVAGLDNWETSNDHLTLMTLHSAKGLEFPAVCIVGMEEGLLPHQRSLDTEDDIQEERRLCYVGMTRAQRHLVMSHAARRVLHGQWMPSPPSRFLAEIPSEHVEHQDRTSGHSSLNPGYGRSGGTNWRRPQQQAAQAGDAVEETVYVPEADDYLDVQLPRRGQAVRHAHFGRGVVSAVSGSGGSARITVRFDRFGEKQLMAEYARLEPA